MPDPQTTAPERPEPLRAATAAHADSFSRRHDLSVTPNPVWSL